MAAEQSLLRAAKAANVKLVRLGDAVLLLPRSQHRQRGVRIELLNCHVMGICNHLCTWVTLRPHAWHRLTVE